MQGPVIYSGSGCYLTNAKFFRAHAVTRKHIKANKHFSVRLTGHAKDKFVQA